MLEKDADYNLHVVLEVRQLQAKFKLLKGLYFSDEDVSLINEDLPPLLYQFPKVIQQCMI